MRFIIETYIKPVLLICAALIIAGVCAMPARQAAQKTALRGADAAAIRASVGKGMLFGILGGYRSLVSDFVWIKAYLEWEKQDVSACVSSIELATTIDPFMVGFWTQGASIIAFDTPHWIVGKRINSKGGEELMKNVKLKQTRIALSFLDRGLKIFPDNSEILIQKGQIAIGAGLFKIAEDAYARAAAKPNPPIYVRRIYASLLTKNGKFKEALSVINTILPELDPDSPLWEIIPKQIKSLESRIKKTEK